MSRVMLGYEPHEWTSTRNFWLTIVHPDDRARAGAETAAIYASRGRGRTEFRWLHRDGHVIWAEAHCQVVLDDKGEPIGMRGVTLDISDRKQLERDRAELLHRERSARADAVAANRLKDDFLATLSHELRTPLNAILGWTRMLRKRRFDEPRASTRLDTSSATRARRRSWSRTCSTSRASWPARSASTCRRSTCARVVEAAIDTVRPAAERKGVRDAGHLGCDGRTAWPAIRDRLQQVVWNLLSNAVKFTPRGGRVQVRLARATRTWRSCVSDTGNGIPPEFLPHVFERFRQADSRPRASTAGSASAWRSSRELVELHGGTIQRRARAREGRDVPS